MISTHLERLGCHSVTTATQYA